MSPAPRFWRVVWALLVAARRRGSGRLKRQLKLRRVRMSFGGSVWPALGFSLGFLVGVVLNLAVAFEISVVNETAARVQAQSIGEIVVEDWFYQRVGWDEDKAKEDPSQRAAMTKDELSLVDQEAGRLSRAHHGDKREIAKSLRAAVAAGGAGLWSEDDLWRRPFSLAEPVTLALFLWWCLTMVCQGEGAQLDIQTPRHPMWEWLFSHPAPPAAIFLAEMLAPIAANPMYMTAPLMPGLLFGLAYGWPYGIAGAVLIGVPLAIALACLGRAIEIRILLGLGPRTRGAALGLMGWFGFISMMASLFVGPALSDQAQQIIQPLLPLAAFPWPPVRALIGLDGHGGLSFLRALAIDLPLTAAIVAASVALSVRAARAGLDGRFAAAPVVRRRKFVRWGRHPLYRREWLWFTRDGSAVVQAVLLPLSMATLQAFNMRQLFAGAMGSWSGVTGAAVLCGTYFLLVLGPKSLASEGQALWIALTWPQGLEGLLKTKARLWASISSLVVALALLASVWRFPGNALQIFAAGVLWLVFARSLAEKVVTLATTTTGSGEQRKVPTGLRWAATLGSISFPVGVWTQQWSLAVAGVVYSTLTAAAMWQNFRFRLPYLFDAWSETGPPPPTLLQATISISLMVEAVSVVTGLAATGLGRDSLPFVAAAAYATAAVVVCGGALYILNAQGVGLRRIALWGQAAPIGRTLAWIGGGAAAGVALGVLAHFYLAALSWWPAAAEALEKSRNALPVARMAYAVMAIGFAPFAEELLFRGLLYRALDREWGGAKAVIGAAALFAAYHPMLSWAPVFALGVMNALLFRRSGTLATSVVAHMAYNATVLGL